MTTAIDLFAGAGGFTEGAEAAGIQVLWAANHAATAVKYHRLNHPHTEVVQQDLHLANFMDAPKTDILIASPCCIPEDGLVVMGDLSYRSIKDVALGDLVLTHAGRGRPVTNIWPKRYTGDMLSLIVAGDTKTLTKMTADHLVWVNRRGGHSNKFSEPQFVRADQVRPGDYVAFPRTSASMAAAALYVKALEPGRVAYSRDALTVSAHARQSGRQVAAFTRLSSESSLPGAKMMLDGHDPSLWWLIGHYLGDGQSRNDRPEVGWSVGGTLANLNKVRDTLASLGLSSWLWGEEGNQAVFTSSTHLHALVTSFGAKSFNKCIPAAVLELPHSCLRQLVEGYLDADGSLRKDRMNPEWRATSVSLELLQGVQRICWQLGWSAGLSRQDYARQAVIEGREVTCRDSWGIAIKKVPHATSRTKFFGEHVWRSVVAVDAEPVVDVSVIDIEVEEDHTFCLPGVVVHNCQGHGNAAGKKRNSPSHDKSRNTAQCVVAAVQAHRHDAFVLENVKEFLEWELYPAWAHAMTILGYTMANHIVDAADYGVPQHRERLFIVGTKSKNPLYLHPPKQPHIPASSFIEWDAHPWRKVVDKVAATQRRVENGRRAFGDTFLAPFYGDGSGLTGRSLDRPVGTITTVDRWAVVRGDEIRVFQPSENRAAMGFRRDFILPKVKREATHVLGNAVPPKLAEAYLNELQRRM